MLGLPTCTRHSSLLLVDDDVDMHHFVANALRSQEIDLAFAMSGAEAIQAAQRQQFDLVLLDYDLPDTNGLELLTQLRSATIDKSVPVVFLTQCDSPKLLAECFGLYPEAFLRTRAPRSNAVVA